MSREIFEAKRLNPASAMSLTEPKPARLAIFNPDLDLLFYGADRVRRMGFEKFAAELYSEAAKSAAELYLKTLTAGMTARIRRGRADFGILAVWGHMQAGNIGAAVDFIQGFLADPHVPEKSREKAMEILRPTPKI